MFSCLPNDPLIEKLDPALKLFMFYNWLEDQNDEVEVAKNHAYLLGSFWNPEAVKKLTGDGSQTFTSTDEEFDKSTEMVLNQEEVKPITKKKGKRKIKS